MQIYLPHISLSLTQVPAEDPPSEDVIFHLFIIDVNPDPIGIKNDSDDESDLDQGHVVLVQVNVRTCTVVWNKQEWRRKYWATRSSVRTFARTAHLLKLIPPCSLHSRFELKAIVQHHTMVDNSQKYRL